MDDTDKIELKNGMDNTDKIKLKNCTIIDDVVVCDMEREDYKKMRNPPDGLEINVEEEILKNKSIDSSKRTEETTEFVEVKPEPETKEEPATETVEPQTEQKPEEPATETTEKSSCGCSTSDKTENTD